MSEREAVILGALLHDIGKFMQRAEVPCPFEKGEKGGIDPVYMPAGCVELLTREEALTMKVNAVSKPMNAGWDTVYVPFLPGCVLEGDRLEEGVVNIVLH